MKSARGNKKMDRCCLWPATRRRLKRCGTSSLFTCTWTCCRVWQSLGNQKLHCKGLSPEVELGGLTLVIPLIVHLVYISRMFSFYCGEECYWVGLQGGSSLGTSTDQLFSSSGFHSTIWGDFGISGKGTFLILSWFHFCPRQRVYGGFSQGHSCKGVVSGQRERLKWVSETK